jgi:undecaprenyl-diphosphatase
MSGRPLSVLLGLVQGLTEFLPVSSSGHLALLQSLFGIGEAALAYDLILHCATMAATILYFGRDIATLFTQWAGGFMSTEKRRTEGWSVGWAVIAGTVMTAAVGFPMKPFMEQAMTMPLLVGTGLLVTSVLLWYGSSLSSGRTGVPVTLGRGLFIGIVQGVATMPGISRSGSTIVGGMKTGMSAPEAFRFSFLLSLPAISGATLLELRDLLGTPEGFSALPEGWAWGAATAFLSGFVALVALRKVVTMGRWRPFSLYCGALGLLSMFVAF